jgi:hypothetical protein
MTGCPQIPIQRLQSSVTTNSKQFLLISALRSRDQALIRLLDSIASQEVNSVPKHGNKGETSGDCSFESREKAGEKNIKELNPTNNWHNVQLSVEKKQGAHTSKNTHAWSDDKTLCLDSTPWC